MYCFTTTDYCYGPDETYFNTFADLTAYINSLGFDITDPVIAQVDEFTYTFAD